MISDVTLAEDEDAIVEGEVGEAVGDGEDDAALGAGEFVHELDDFGLGFGVETAGDFVAEQEAGGADHFEGHGEAAFLATGEDADFAVADFVEADIAEDFFEARLGGFWGEVIDAKAESGFDAFPDGEEIISDAKLGDVANFVGGHIVVFGEIATIPLYVAGGGFAEAGDDFEESAFSAT
jgi:hypothetical protein